MRNRNLLIILGIIFIIGGTVWQFSVLLSHRGKIGITVQASPSDSVITMNGKKISGGTKYIVAGKYTFTAKRQYFTDYSTTVEINKDSQKDILLLLGADSNEAKAYLKSHPKEQALREAIGGQKANQEGEEASNKNPIVKLLPFIDREYRIDYGPSQLHPDDSSALSITITSTSEQSKQDALDWIRFKGFDPNKLEIYYKNF